MVELANSQPRSHEVPRRTKYLPCKITFNPEFTVVTIENGFIQAKVSTSESLEITELRADFSGNGSFAAVPSVLQKPIRIFADWIPGGLPQPLPATSNISVTSASPSAVKLSAQGRVAGAGAYADVAVTATFHIALNRHEARPPRDHHLPPPPQPIHGG